MPTAVLDGISTRYEVHGSGPAVLMFSPGGFDATVEKWSTLGVYARIRLLDHLPARFSCISFDRRETGQSGGRVERIGWAQYVAQGKALLDHLGVERAHLIGGCMGCAPVVAFAVAHPAATLGMTLIWPVGGARYRINAQLRFARHLAYVQQHGPAGVVALAQSGTESFGADPRGGPWVSVLRQTSDEGRAFAAAYAQQDPGDYQLLVAGMARTLFDRDTAPGAEAEDLMRLPLPALVIPGRDASHATSAARYLEECLPRSDFLDLPPAEQLEHNVTPRILQFIGDTATAAPAAPTSQPI